MQCLCIGNWNRERCPYHVDGSLALIHPVSTILLPSPTDCYHPRGGGLGSGVVIFVLVIGGMNWGGGWVLRSIVLMIVVVGGGSGDSNNPTGDVVGSSIAGFCVCVVSTAVNGDRADGMADKEFFLRSL